MKAAIHGSSCAWCGCRMRLWAAAWTAACGACNGGVLRSPQVLPSSRPPARSAVHTPLPCPPFSTVLGMQARRAPLARQQQQWPARVPPQRCRTRAAAHHTAPGRHPQQQAQQEQQLQQQQEQQPHQQQRQQPQFRLRQATAADAPAVAALYQQAFGHGVFAGSGVEDNPLLQQLEAAYAGAVGRESGEQLVAALEAKAQAALASRAYRLQREAALLRARLCVARGEPAVFPTEGPEELRQKAKWRRARKFVCLVAEERPDSGSASTDGNGSDGSSGSGRLLGTATICLMQVEALLPPPFPSSAPLRPLLSNMAVAERARRRGVATALAAAVGRVARAWGEPDVLLHVGADNAAARALYARCGFELAPGGAGLSGLLRGPQQRMIAASARLAGAGRRLRPGGGDGDT